MSEELERFIEITKIPRCSGSNGLIGDYLENFAEQNGFAHERDEVGNIMIERPGKTDWMILQAHQDMVADSVDPDFDFRTQQIHAFIDGDWIRADGTTLGADDGSGIALSLCALTAPELKDISLRCIYTVDEETGLEGALRIRKEWLSGTYLINIDSEEDYIITKGCAGCIRMISEISNPMDSCKESGWKISVSGLLGGHSASDIDKNRANAILIAAEFLKRLENVCISSFNGGDLPNSIPRECSVSFSSDSDVQKELDSFMNIIRARYDDSDHSAKIAAERCDIGRKWPKEISSSLIDTVLALPNGMFERSDEGVITSSNTGVVRTEGNKLSISNMPRSSDAESLRDLEIKIISTMDSMGAKTEVVNRNPAWREPSDTELMRKSAETYREVFGKEPIIAVVHGGLECGIFLEKNPKLQQISIGPTILNAHSVNECMSISSLSRMKSYLYRLLIRLTE